jgi:hypothetical protein
MSFLLLLSVTTGYYGYRLFIGSSGVGKVISVLLFIWPSVMVVVIYCFNYTPRIRWPADCCSESCRGARTPCSEKCPLYVVVVQLKICVMKVVSMHVINVLHVVLVYFVVVLKIVVLQGVVSSFQNTAFSFFSGVPLLCIFST